MNKTILVIASLFGLLSIAFGAFGAHSLKALISVESLQTFETGIRYQMYHTLVLLFVGSTTLIQQKTKKIIFYLIVFGVVFFSGSIYGLATNNLTSFDFKTLGFITPIGGLLLIASWILLLINFIKMKSK